MLGGTDWDGGTDSFLAVCLRDGGLTWATPHASLVQEIVWPLEVLKGREQEIWRFEPALHILVDLSYLGGSLYLTNSW